MKKYNDVIMMNSIQSTGTRSNRNSSAGKRRSSNIKIKENSNLLKTTESTKQKVFIPKFIDVVNKKQPSTTVKFLNQVGETTPKSLIPTKPGS